MRLQVKKINPDAKIPAYAYESDAGMDLFSAEDLMIAPGERAVVGTGLAMAIPAGHAGLVWDKSGIATKHGLKVLAGVIDESYRGEVKVALVNLGNTPFEVKKGEKIAQMIIQAVAHPDIAVVDNLENTERGEGGFGSTGTS